MQDEQEKQVDSLFYLKKILERAKSPLSFKVGTTILVLLLTLALFGPFFYFNEGEEPHVTFKNLAPTKEHLFGTDELGRDLFVRCCMGLRVSLLVGVAASVIDLFIGLFYGVVAGCSSSLQEEWLMRIIDILQSIPYLLIVLLFVAVFGPGLKTMIIALALTGWINMARVGRAGVLKIKNEEFILAAKGFGVSQLRLFTHYLFPSLRGTILVVLMATVPSALFTEAFLSFLGLGIQSPAASLGTLANDGLLALRYYPWRIFFPSLFICLVIFSLNLIGDGLREIFDERAP